VDGFAPLNSAFKIVVVDRTHDDDDEGDGNGDGFHLLTPSYAWICITAPASAAASLEMEPLDVCKHTFALFNERFMGARVCPAGPAKVS
jgi:hypothetical protein